MYCHTCGAQIAEGSKFCTVCGAPTVLGLSDRTSANGTPLLPAGVGKRLGNFVIDQLCTSIIAFFVGFFFALLVKKPPIGISFVLGFLVTAGYYIFFEALWQRTPGKWATSTKVVREDGTRPTFGQILGRSCTRLIPFESISFLFSQNPLGWHDRFAKTLVVSHDLNAEDVQKFNLEEIKKKKNDTVAIVVTVVFLSLMIVGLVSTGILASLGKPQSKQQNEAEIYGNLSTLPSQSKSFYQAHNNSYYNICFSSDAFPKILLGEKYKNFSSSPYTCWETPTTWAVSAEYNLGQDIRYLCIDNTMNEPVQAVRLLGSDTDRTASCAVIATSNLQ